MEIVKAKNIGFCNGVDYSIKEALKLLETGDKIYCLGKIVHNDDVLVELENKGLIFINNIEDALDGSLVIFRAHGEAIETYKKAEKRHIKVIDLTCGKVRAIHVKVQKYLKDCFIIVIGKKEHPEIIGTKSFAGDNSIVVSDIDDISKAYDLYNKQSLKKVYVCVQTTFSLNKYNLIIDKIKEVFKNVELIIDNTICSSSIDRQEETMKIAKKVKQMIVIGDKCSSNTKELYNNSLKYCDNTVMVQNKDDLKDVVINDNSIGVVSGSSTPIEVVDSLIKEITN